MGNVLVVGEIKDGNLKKISKELASSGKRIAESISGQVEVLLIGDGAEKFSSELGAVGADKVITAKAGEFSAEGYANIVSSVVSERKPSVVLMPHTSYGKDYSPRVAIKTGSGIVADVVGLTVEGGKVIGKKPIYSGKAYANIKVNSEIQMFTVRPNSQEVVQKSGSGATEASNAGYGDVKVKNISSELSGGSKVQLAEASIVVSGGRGMKGPENFPMLQQLCDILGAALGASRAAVDAGWISHTHQVGQTGKTVSPNCYIACGISGSIQHMAGMGSSKYIVAINKDPDAPIFKVSTYGVVADLFDVVPALITEFKSALG
ncbi:MAG: electron transfer flavoprotein subunit alpha/FixB family protein [Leptospiraceae bacterium]|nr:electron transfer flavoprotein subunit alpha/FixB family protein [Leptospiraceae bacterium]MCK6382336.1 electron transfer flavoprotein subunit alpha/FixB family protein [Leptospiraceae bacterium]NUM40367.1 electron transfer flavoprotein subunit alpha/FixB family protein [Leptospiraceae bacterium]